MSLDNKWSNQGMATQEPELTEHSRPTFVGSYITRHVATFNPMSVQTSAYKRSSFLGLLVVGDVNGTQ